MSSGPGSWAEDPGEQAYSERGSPENVQGVTLQVGGDDVREGSPGVDLPSLQLPAAGRHPASGRALVFVRGVFALIEPFAVFFDLCPGKFEEIELLLSFQSSEQEE